MKNPTQAQLDQAVQDLIDDGCAFPYVVAHCPRAIALLDELIKTGQQTHGPMDWKQLGSQGNVERATAHLREMMNKYSLDRSADHFLNAACRMIMALELREETKDTVKQQQEN